VDPKVAEPADPVDDLQDAIDTLDTQLQSGNPPFNSDEHCDLQDKRDALDDKQRILVKKVFQTDDATYMKATADLHTATEELKDEIKNAQRLDQIILIATQMLTVADTLIALA
jgi:hypothetical protein